MDVVGNTVLEDDSPCTRVASVAWRRGTLGISKPEQALSYESWGKAPIGAGPFSLTYDPDSGLTELTRVDLVGKHWNGPHGTPDHRKLDTPRTDPDVQTQVLMFENGELDLMKIDSETYHAALDPGHPFNGSWSRRMAVSALNLNTDQGSPMEDLGSKAWPPVPGGDRSGPSGEQLRPTRRA